MKKFEVIQTVKINSGTEIGLTKEQAARRAHAVEKKGRFFVAVLPLQFKAGEVIELGDMPKGQDAYFSPVSEKPEKADD